MDVFKLTPGHVLTGMVVIGGILAGFGLYEPLVKFAGAGASVPITSFGAGLTKGALAELQKDGLIGVLSGVFDLTSAGITAAIVFGVIVALVFHPKR
jgi:stage V sporulation protein AE